MKELSIEEKAKAYDGLIERLKDLKFVYRFSSLGDTIEEKFPELKESKDEKIRKWIIAYLEYRVMNTSITDEKDNCLNAIRWLEKQGEQKPADSKIIDLDELVIELEETIGTSPHSRETIKDFFQRAVQKYMNCLKIANGEIGRLVDENYLLKEKQNEQKPVDIYNVCDTCDEQAGCVNPCPMKLIEQKPNNWIQELEDKLANATPKQLAEWKEKYFKEEPAWSKEDEKIANSIWDSIDKSVLANYGVDEDKAFEWLSHIKDRVQPKQEWSEEDEEMYKDVLTDIIYAKNNLEAKECFGLSKRAMEAFNWFSKRYKSLRPQNTWKPSIAQLNALSIVSKGNATDDIEAIVSLYNDLKKLREE